MTETIFTLLNSLLIREKNKGNFYFEQTIPITFLITLRTKSVNETAVRKIKTVIVFMLQYKLC